jgi:ABC-2 type transport system ATP-binding protein
MTPMEKVLGPLGPGRGGLGGSPEPVAVQTGGLTKRYGRVTALNDCTITVPEGRISALIGPNGAGKTTLLRLLAGLARPTAGQVTVNGVTPHQDPAFLADIGFLAQEVPLYRRLTAEDHIRAGAHLNPRWDAGSVRERLTTLKIPLNRAVGKLSGGQRAQVALALILAKRPRLLLLDEPVAALDPLARRNFLGLLADGVEAGGLTVILSSHLVADLERVSDHLIMLASSRVQLCGDIDDLLAEHRILVGPRKDTTALQRTHRVVQVTHTPRQTTLLARLNGPVIDPAFQATEVSLEDVVLAYMGEDAPPALANVTSIGSTGSIGEEQ